MSAPAEGSAAVCDRGPAGPEPGEQIRKAGVYIDVFEQSILADKRKNKPLSFCASVSAELVAIGLLIVIPIISGDHLPDFHWKAITLGAPPRPLEPRPVPAASRTATTSANPFRATRVFQQAALQTMRAEPVIGGDSIEPPPGWIPVSGANATAALPVSTFMPGAASPPRIEEHPVSSTPGPAGPVRVSMGVQEAKILRRVLPVYPALARQLRVSGVVHLVGIIGRDGTIRNLQLINGHPLLSPAAIEAVRQWVYRPTLLSGEPVEVIAPIDVVFTLSQ